MSVTFNPEVAQRRFAESSDEELVRIAYVDGDSYVPEALVLAKEELRLRGIDGASHPAAVAARRVVESTKLEAKAKSELPANSIILLLSFVLADLFAIVAAILYSTNGRARGYRRLEGICPRLARANRLGRMGNVSVGRVTSNCVFKPTAGAMLVPNRPSLASGGLTRR